MVLCVSFNLWYWVYHLMVCDEVTLCEFQETRCSSQNLRLYRERLFLSFFLHLFLSACIITSSLIHEATTLMEKLFKLCVAPSRRSAASRRSLSDRGYGVGVFVLWIRESPPSIMITRNLNWSFRDSKARDWLNKGKVLAPLVRPI
jgi:hypothetical protein